MFSLTILCQYLVGDLGLEGQDLIDITASAILGFSGVGIQPDVQNNSKVVPSDFGEDIMEELRVLGFDRADGADFMDHLPPSEYALRRDLRTELVITVDPTTSQDFDDALHVKACDGGFEVGIHIADVSYFVRPGSKLDKEAQLRCATTYLQGFNVPMLPHLLSTNLCSLNPGVDRLAFSVIVYMRPDGTVDDQRTWFGRTIISNKCRMDYQTAQGIIDGTVISTKWPPQYPLCNSHGTAFTSSDVITSIKTLKDLAFELQKMGKKTEFGDKFLEFVKDPETKLPIAFEWRNIKWFSQILIEMFMVLANAAGMIVFFGCAV